ncbi:ABC transporter permease [Acuticoccus yangtzensis]|uniref:ABC transporter permease n=1 Tax=Acuticoccus yangtzensis TaxID=1443441 RepID=UPI0009498B1D|nr:ABC transporter permease subunit [Acuticoccus yangtzensis]ORE94248.1 binding-protein-dependent transporter system inner membrane protein [Stappia sp. 22II-S9-Z10]
MSTSAVPTDAAAQPARPARRALLPQNPRARNLTLNALPVLGLVAVWWFVTAFVLVQPRLYPTPLAVAGELVRILSGDGPLGSTYVHAAATFSRLLVAWSGAFVIGTVLGVIGGRNRWFFDFCANPVWIAMAVPSVVWVYIFLVLFGIDNLVPITALLVLLTAPVFLGTAEGVRAVSPDMIEMCDSYKIGPIRRLFHFYLPSIAPYLVANARVSFALGIRIVIIAEVIGLPNGVGLLVGYWSDSLYMAPLVAWGIILMLVGVAVDHLVFVPLQRRIRQETVG